MLTQRLLDGIGRVATLHSITDAALSAFNVECVPG